MSADLYSGSWPTQGLPDDNYIDIDRCLDRVKEGILAPLEIDRSHYLEARTWLVADLASLQPDGQAREQAWQTLLPKPGSKYREGEENLVMQLFVLMSELWPKDMGSLLHDRPDVFVDFFSGPELRILLWFSHFSMDGMRSFKYGAYALAHYCLAHREEAWDLLQWEGKHPQAPVSVAAKTHYFCELALVPSLKALLRHDAFWSSEEWRTCLVGGEFLSVEPTYFSKVLAREYELGSAVGRRAAELLQRFTAHRAAWQPACQRMLPGLQDEQLLAFINAAASCAPPLSIASTSNRGGAGTTSPRHGTQPSARPEQRPDAGRGYEGGHGHGSQRQGMRHEQQSYRDGEYRYGGHDDRADDHSGRRPGGERRSRGSDRDRDRGRGHAQERRVDDRWQMNAADAGAGGHEDSRFARGNHGDGGHGQAQQQQQQQQQEAELLGVSRLCGGGWQDLSGLLLGGVRWNTLMDAVLCCALASHRAALARLAHEAVEDELVGAPAAAAAPGGLGQCQGRAAQAAAAAHQASCQLHLLTAPLPVLGQEQNRVPPNEDQTQQGGGGDQGQGEGPGQGQPQDGGLDGVVDSDAPASAEPLHARVERHRRAVTQHLSRLALRGSSSSTTRQAAAAQARLQLLLHMWAARTALLAPPLLVARAPNEGGLDGGFQPTARLEASSAPVGANTHATSHHAGALLASDTPQARIASCLEALPGVKWSNTKQGIAAMQAVSGGAGGIDAVLQGIPAGHGARPGGGSVPDRQASALPVGVMGREPLIGQPEGRGGDSKQQKLKQKHHDDDEYELLPDDPFSSKRRRRGGKKKDKKRSKNGKHKKTKTSSGRRRRHVRSKKRHKSRHSGSESSSDDDRSSNSTISSSSSSSGSGGSRDSSDDESNSPPYRSHGSSDSDGPSRRRRQRKRSRSARNSGDSRNKVETDTAWWLQLPGESFPVASDASGVADSLSAVAAKHWLAKILKRSL